MEAEKKDNKKIIIIVVVIALLVLGGLLIFKNSASKPATSENPSSELTAINGVFDINGVIPDGATLVLTQQEVVSGSTPTEFATITNPTDRQSWVFDKAVTGKTYVIQGSLKSSNGVELITTSRLTVSAPAANEVLTLNVEGKGLTGVAEVSGVVRVNGFFPTGSTISLMTRSANTQFKAGEKMPAQAETAVSFNTAVAGLRYDVIGYLYNPAGTKIGESSVLSLVAPARNEILVINSTATAPTPSVPAKPSARITGTIRLNGVAPDNSRIMVLQRLKGDPDFTVAVDNIPARDGQNWAWSSAQDSTWYDMVAVLKQRQQNGTDRDVATSTEMTIAAPAINVLFTLNTGIPLPPTPTPTAAFTPAN